jgi:hypothetical protein
MQIRKSNGRTLQQAVTCLVFASLISVGAPRPAHAQEARARDQQPAATSEAPVTDGDALIKGAVVAGVNDSAEESPVKEVRKGGDRLIGGKEADSLARLREQLAVTGANRFLRPAVKLDPKLASRYSVPSPPQSGSGKKVRKGPLTAALIGLGLIGGGAYFIATPNPPKTINELFDQDRFDRRFDIGIPMVTVGAILAVFGFKGLR